MKLLFSTKSILRVFLIGSLLLFLGACQQWNLEEFSFLNIKIDQVLFPTTSTAIVNFTIEGLLEDATLTDHGLVWSSTDSLPDILTTEITIKKLGAQSENRSFSIEIGDLSPNQPYWLRAFGELDNKIYYSASVPLFLAAELEVTQIDLEVVRGTTYALATGSIDGLPDNVNIEAYGHCWTNENRLPLITDNRTVFGSSDINIPSFTSEITNLESFQKYYIRPYAKIGGREFYGAVDSLDKRDVWIPYNDGSWFEVHQAQYYSMQNKGYMLIIPPWSNGTNNFWEYDPLVDIWTKQKDCPAPRRHFPFFANTDQKIFVGLGFLENGQKLNDIWEYDSASTLWRKLNDFPLTGRSFPTSFTINGKIYMAFGDSDSQSHDDIWRFDPDDGPNGTWHLEILHCDCKSRKGSFAFVIDGKAYIVGGSSSEIVVFDPTNTAKPCYVKESNFQLKRVGPVAMAHKGRGYYGGGITGDAETKNDFWEFDPNYLGNGFDVVGEPMGRWIKIGNITNLPIQSGRENAIAFSIDDRLFVGFGFHNHYSDEDFWEYIPDE